MTNNPKFRPTKPISLFKDGLGRPNKDSEFFSGIVRENVQFGGATVYVWLYEGTFDQVREDGTRDTILDEGLVDGLQDSILGENRDRKYSDDSYKMVGAYTVSQHALDFARFGVMLSDDVIQMEFHKREMERILGRRLIPGDVLEFPHLRDVGIDGRVMNRFYKVSSIVKSPTGYDATYEWHLMAVTMTPIQDAQEFIDLMEREIPEGGNLRDMISNRERMMEITAASQEAAIEHAYTTWFDTTALYIDKDSQVPYRWFDDGEPPNGEPVSKVSAFPPDPDDGDYVLRVDFYPNRLFRYQGGIWLLKEVDRKREWGTYNWTAKLREFASDQSEDDELRPWELKSIHDVATPRHDRSDPSPGPEDPVEYVPPPEVGAWDNMIVVDSPNASEDDIVTTRTVTLTANTGAPIDVSADYLNATTGLYQFFYVQYTLTRGAASEMGELMIADDGTNTEFNHQYASLSGDVGLTFSVTHSGGIRHLQYISTAGADITMSFRVVSKW